MRKSVIQFVVGLFCAVPLLVSAKAPELVDLRVFPADINLKTARDRQSVVVQAVYADGVTRDVTAQSSISFADKGLVKFENATVHPLADGATEMKIKFSGRALTIPVKVESAKNEPAMSFKLDVMPVFMKAGCNSGGCHGASRGKDGFRLSLFGYDPDGDYARLTTENIARRINLAIPEESLLLEKSIGRVQHTGGELFKADSELYQTVLRWLKEGAQKDAGQVPKVVSVDLYPKELVLEGTGATHRMTVRAKYSDGTDRDVTSLAVFMSNNDVAAAISKEGVVTAGARGEAFLMARFETHTVGAQALVIPKGLKFTFPETTENNYIDKLIHAKLKKLRIAPSELADDATFLRRAYLDLIGQLPSPQEVRSFQADISTGKRERVIDELLNRPEFADIWVMKWSELLQIRVADQVLRFSNKSVRQYHDWLGDQIRENVPVNKMAGALLTATGPSFQNPAANFYKVETDTLKLTENVAQVFMGMRIQCAQCHNHPFDRWTMDDYYSFAAFFAQIGRKNGEDPRETIVFNRGGGGVRHPVGNKDMPPKFLGGDVPEIKGGQDRREVLANWMISPENPYFARNFVNIVWAHFLGKGIIDPVDDVRVSNPASNPELLDELAKQFVASNFDFKKLVRDICNSRAYQLSVKSNETNAGDDRNFAKANIRRIRAEVLLDITGQVTETQEKFPGLPQGSRAVEIPDGRISTYFLTTFGRATRETPCSCEVKMEPNLSQALHLLNGDTVNNKIQRGAIVRNLLKQGKTPDQVIEELYLRCLSRPPTAEELTKLKAFIQDEKTTETVLNDIFWSLLNSKEFVFNH
ncbi:MAG: DUF1549 and DUF1553 domain-containing protein [Verrucomicrobiota bacterium]